MEMWTERTLLLLKQISSERTAPQISLATETLSAMEMLMALMQLYSKLISLEKTVQHAVDGLVYMSES